MLLSETFKNKKFYASYITIVRQAVSLTSSISGKNYLRIIAFSTSSSRVEGGISYFVTESYYKSMVVK